MPAKTLPIFAVSGCFKHHMIKQRQVTLFHVGYFKSKKGVNTIE
ncbi:hypothetical protein C427_4401 [Paraglaciecola psychrophila 170]|uniref:Uncharacterized protein n=1 Tax=Paraglaciecola psychrophila 170 TaxID=1129794 RepID=K6Z289_9ALTE|nr:hypothetical protein C427_4401 [Paraglaciecola psychrophila 170]GAC39169.1 hypothetical protein GPSY_3558 [Paraglaciecola psychrophila 170]